MLVLRSLAVIGLLSALLLAVSSVAILLGWALWSVIKENNKLEADVDYLNEDNRKLLAGNASLYSRLQAARDGLINVQNLRTGKMANVGHRMVDVARKAQAKADAPR